MVALLRHDYVAPRRTAAKKAAKEVGSAVVHGAFVLNEKQYEHFEKCMKEPEQPTPAMLAAHEKLEQFRSGR